QLALQFVDTGGVDPNFVLNALDVRPTSVVLPMTINPIGAVQADGLTIDTYTATVGGVGVPDGTLITLATPLGTLLADQSALYAGVQRVVVGNAFAFQVLRPSGIGTGSATITANEVSGLAQGSLVQTYTFAAVRRLDFNAGNSPTQAGFLPVSASAPYTA